MVCCNAPSPTQLKESKHLKKGCKQTPKNISTSKTSKAIVFLDFFCVNAMSISDFWAAWCLYHLGSLLLLAEIEGSINAMYSFNMMMVNQLR